MDREKILNAIKEARKAKKRKFVQSFDFSMVLDIDISKPENKIEEYVVLPCGRGKQAKICAFVDKELVIQAKEIFDFVIPKEEFENWVKKPREIKKLMRKYDFFVAQANIMQDVAKAFGRYLGPKGKMPSPKAGAIITPKSDLKAVVEKLRNTVKLSTKKIPVVSCIVGKEDMKDEDIAKNIEAVYETIEKKLPRGKDQIKKLILKLTMGNKVLI